MKIFKALDNLKEKATKALDELLPRPAPQLAPIPVRARRPPKRR